LSSSTLKTSSITVAPDDAELVHVPSPAQALVWQQLRELERIRAECLRRDEAADRRHTTRVPVSWAVSIADRDAVVLIVLLLGAVLVPL
jgi:hypothetical protein